MELRPPPPPSAAVTSRTSGWLVVVVVLQLAVLAAAGVLLWMDRPQHTISASSQHTREIASKLKAAGATQEAAGLYEHYLQGAHLGKKDRAKIAFSLGNLYADDGQYEKALRWFYESQSLGGGGIADDVNKKIVYCLERLGRIHAAQAALASSVGLGSGKGAKHAADDPVVARIGKQEIHRSDVLRALDDLPPQLSKQFGTPSKRQAFLRKYVADELLWQKARKLQYDKDPDVRRQLEELYKQLVISKFVQREVVGKVKVDDADLKDYFTAHKDQYKDAKGKAQPFDKVRSRVEQDYRAMKVQEGYRKIIEQELSAKDVQLYPEAMKP